MMNKRFCLFFSLLLAFCFSSVAVHARFREKKSPPYLTIIGGVNMADGLGRQSIEMIEALRDSLDIGFKKTYVDSTQGISPRIAPWLKELKSGWGQVIVCQEPIEQSARMLSRRSLRQIRIAYSMIESTRIPKKWVDRFNRKFDLVAVPDRFLVDVYKKSGVKIPVFELPLGRNLASFLQLPLKKEKKTPFVFGNFSSGIGRKNQVGLIRAFAKAFRDRPDVSLAIHCRTCEPKVQKQIEEEIQKAQGAAIQFTIGALDQEAYLQFLQKVDCYVSSSKGEGFSIQPREAMTLGIPVIATDNTAQHTICESGLVKAVPCPIEESAIYEWHDSPLGSFFSCTEEALAEALQEVEQKFEEYLAKGPEARSWAAQTDYQQLKPLYLTLVNPQKIILGSENRITPNCLITSSKKLYRKYQALCQPKREKKLRKALKSKIARNTPPQWMVDQVTADLACIGAEQISQQALDEAMNQLQKEKTLVARYRIHNNRLEATYAPNPKGEIRGGILERSLKRLLKIAQISDVDFIVSLEDAADQLEYSFPVFAFAKDARLSHPIILIPDFEAFSSNQKAVAQIKANRKKYPWSEKRAQGIWRGAMTGQMFTVDNFSMAPRSQLVAQSLQYPDLIDAAFVGVCQCDQPDEIASRFSSYFSKPIGIEEHLQYKYQILVDGNSCAYSRAYWQLFSGSLVFKQESPNIQWYYRCLTPYVHYVPMAFDCRDLPEKMRWAQTHDRVAERISQNAQLFASTNLKKEDIYYYLYLLLTEYGKIQGRSVS